MVKLLVWLSTFLKKNTFLWITLYHHTILSISRKKTEVKMWLFEARVHYCVSFFPWFCTWKEQKNGRLVQPKVSIRFLLLLRDGQKLWSLHFKKSNLDNIWHPLAKFWPSPSNNYDLWKWHCTLEYHCYLLFCSVSAKTIISFLKNNQINNLISKHIFLVYFLAYSKAPRPLSSLAYNRHCLPKTIMKNYILF